MMPRFVFNRVGLAVAAYWWQRRGRCWGIAFTPANIRFWGPHHKFVTPTHYVKCWSAGPFSLTLCNLI